MRSINMLLRRSPLQRPMVLAAGLSALLLAAASVFLFVGAPFSTLPVSKPRDDQPVVGAQTGKPPLSSPTTAEEPASWLMFRSHSAAELRAVANDMNRQGYELRTINGYSRDGMERHATLWHRGTSGTSRVGWEFQADAYQKRQDELSSSGFKPVFVAAYESSKGIRYADVWRKGRPADWVLRREMAAEELQAAIIELRPLGLQPVHVYGFGLGGKSQFIAIFEPLEAEPNLVSIDTPGRETKAIWESHFQKGYRPKVISGYRLLNSDHLTILWEKGQGWGSFGITEKDLDSNISGRRKQGLNLIYLNVYAGLGGLRHNMIWAKQ